MNININKIRKIVGLPLFFLILFALLTGCKKLLDQRPENSLTRQDFFKTEADANASIAGVYDALQASVTQLLLWGESRSDLVSSISTDDIINYPYQQLFTNLRPLSNWSTVYQVIARANIVIEAIPGIVSIDANFTNEKSNAILAEARCLRALSYFYLLRTFKEVPLVLDASSSDDVNYRIPKSPADVILKKIEEDLAFAAQYAPTQFARPIDTRGRITKGAVYALQADVYLWEAKWKESADAAKKVLDNTALYSLVSGSDWFSIFSKKNTTEAIFELQFDYTLNENNGLKGTSTQFNANNVLVSYFTGEQDALRGLNRTYRESGGRQYWKYLGLNVDNIERPTNDPNYIFYRLPDVMLMRAEALAHLGFAEKTEAISLLNAVRDRVTLAPYLVDGSIETATLVDFILKERAMELSMEGKRWFDLVRVATNDNRPELLVNSILNSRTVGERAIIRARIIDPRSWYLPILKDELDRNPSLVQNPYYR
ncbi:MAG: RagB/SusD family nutrient uptake outer membrane protein [Sphingobacteriaceae bacterium]|nr:MAG: RagB/SusD family nutrient uptake outer membrane protein [Sphingobacteriaceae bacterium]